MDTWRVDTLRAIDVLLEDVEAQVQAPNTIPTFRRDIFRLVCDQTAEWLAIHRPDLPKP